MDLFFNLFYLMAVCDALFLLERQTNTSALCFFCWSCHWNVSPNSSYSLKDELFFFCFYCGTCYKFCVTSPYFLFTWRIEKRKETLKGLNGFFNLLFHAASNGWDAVRLWPGKNNKMLAQRLTAKKLILRQKELNWLKYILKLNVLQILIHPFLTDVDSIGLNVIQ